MQQEGTWTPLDSGGTSNVHNMSKPKQWKPTPTTPSALMHSNMWHWCLTMWLPQQCFTNNHANRTCFCPCYLNPGSSRGPRTHWKGKSYNAFNVFSWSTTLWGSMPTGSPLPTMSLQITSHNYLTTSIHFPICSLLYRHFYSYSTKIDSIHVQSLSHTSLMHCCKQSFPIQEIQTFKN